MTKILIEEAPREIIDREEAEYKPSPVIHFRAPAPCFEPKQLSFLTPVVKSN